jgi:hypothetical protein
MTPTTARKCVFKLLLPVFVLLLTHVSANEQSYTPEETTCYTMVQGKVAE